MIWIALSWKMFVETVILSQHVRLNAGYSLRKHKFRSQVHSVMDWTISIIRRPQTRSIGLVCFTPRDQWSMIDSQDRSANFSLRMRVLLEIFGQGREYYNSDRCVLNQSIRIRSKFLTKIARCPTSAPKQERTRAQSAIYNTRSRRRPQTRIISR